MDGSSYPLAGLLSDGQGARHTILDLPLRAGKLYSGARRGSEPAGRPPPSIWFRRTSC